MNIDSQLIPTRDYLGKRVKIGDKAIMFSKHGTYYEGKIIQDGGKRWFQINEHMRIGGIGNCLMLKD